MKQHALTRVLTLIIVLCSSMMITPVFAHSLSQPRSVQTTWHVASSGSNTSGCGTQESPCQTLQFTVNQAASGDSILVAGGTYTFDAANDICTPNLGTTGVLCVVNKELTVLGQYSTQDWSQPSTANVTVIDGEQTTRGVLVLSTGPDTGLTMEGITIQNGRAGGIPARPDLVEQIAGFGGGMMVEFSSLKLNNVIFQNNIAVGENTANEFGGPAGGGALALKFGKDTVQLDNLQFIGNIAKGGSGSVRGGYAIGGAYYSYKTVAHAKSILFDRNQAQAGSSDGGGRTTDGEFSDAQGGAAAAQIDSDVVFEDVVAQQNQAIGGAAPNGNAGGGFGGAFYAESAKLTIVNSIIRDNTAQGGNGINSIATSSGTGLALGGGITSFTSNVLFERVTVIANLCKGGDGQTLKGSAGGGGIAIISSSTSTNGTVKNSLIAGNRLEMGGGSSNEAGGGGGGLWVQGMAVAASQLTLADNVLGDPALQGEASVVLSFGSPGTLDLSYSIIANHTGTRSALYTQVDNVVNLNRNLFANNTQISNNGDPGAGTTNGVGESLTAADAEFVSPGTPNYDYHLLESSSAIDQAVGSVEAVDRDGVARQSTPDLGAYEVVQAFVGDEFVFLPMITK